MKVLRPLLLPLVLISGIAIDFLYLSSDSSSEARFIHAAIFVDGEAYFQSSTSDDGSPNVDAVWAYLPGLKFEATEAFLESKKNTPVEQTVTLAGKDNDREIEIRIAYGGLALVRELTLDYSESVWSLSLEQVEKFASNRWIRRNEVDGICEERH